MTALLYELMYVIPLSLLCAAGGRSLAGAPEKRLPVFFCVFVVTGICMIPRHAKGRYKYLFPGMAAALSLGIILMQDKGERASFILDNSWVLRMAFLTLACCFAGWLLSASLIARRIFAGLIAAGLIGSLFFPGALDKAETALIIYLLILLTADMVQHHRNKAGRADTEGHMVSLLPVFVITGILVFLSPAPASPYSWKPVRILFDNAVSLAKSAGRIFHAEEEDYTGVIGFSENSDLRGELEKDDRDMLVVSFKRNTGELICLKGKVMDTFNGRGWYSEDQEINHDSLYDTLDTLCSVTGSDPDHIADYIREAEVGVRYEDFDTRYLFVPLKTAGITGMEDGGRVFQEGGDIKAEGSLGYGSGYTVPFIRLNENREIMERLTRGNSGAYGGPAEKAVFDAVIRRYGMDGGELSFKELLSYRKNLKRYYLPETKVSERTEELLDRLLDGCGSDHEKLTVIEEYLSSLTYTLSPGEVPEGIDDGGAFLDWFLFEKKAGYCSHFATAFVLMARSRGIPARYVQGFRVPRGGKDEVTVRSSMAHAWPEAYVEGAGWIRFEPSPGMGSYTGWGEDTWEKERHSLKVQEENEAVTEAEEESASDHEASDASAGVKRVLIPVAAVTAFLALFLFTGVLLRKIRYRALKASDRFMVICRKNIRLLRYLGISMEQGETLEELRTRTCARTGSECLGFLEDYETVLYAGRTADEDMCRMAEGNRRLIYECIAGERGRAFAKVIGFMNA